ncbi:FAD-dependent oxidoreductase [Nocardioides glacieisoli]|uniref:FAD-dependent oxidoreductase n=1 Tax=Nocardioides glacieisoli TaxID=1168730 RepID=UPI0024141415|nr:FAD-dependent oxidoreductase [Nocardioides glacieisoli]
MITQACCNDASCVAVCPVQCIRPRPGDSDFATTEQLYIDPATCIDCGACAYECPVDAIFPEEDLPPPLADFRDINADYFALHPLEDVRPLPVKRHRLPDATTEFRVAVIGAGPSAMYAVAELSEMVGVSVTVLERTPTPLGLLRAGVAPDHEGTKLIGERFSRVLQRPNVECLFNVEVGRDVSVAELLIHHHAVICAVGAADDRKLGIPGEDLEGSVSAREFVAWYNGHPDYSDRHFDLSGKRAVVIGNGNVALDVARVLARPASAYEKTTMSDVALEALRGSAIEEVMVVGRRGQVFGAYSTAELLALERLPGVDLLAYPAEVSVTDEELVTAGLEESSFNFARRRGVIDAAARRTPVSPRRIIMRYRLKPTALIGEDAVRGVVLTEADGTSEAVETSLVIRAVGFRARSMPGIPFDSSAGIIPNDAGRIVDPDTGRPLPGLYCAGWVKRGPSGVIGTNRTDSAETVASLLEDLADGRVPQPVGSSTDFADLIRSRQPYLVDRAGWRRIEEAELGAGAATGRTRVKLLNSADLLKAARGA